MYKKLLFVGLLFTFFSCTKTGGGSTTGGSDCGMHDGHLLHKGRDGGCYYINDNGNKVYVDRSECHC